MGFIAFLCINLKNFFNFSRSRGDQTPTPVPRARGFIPLSPLQINVCYLFMIYVVLDKKAPKFNDAKSKDCLASNWKFKPCDAPNDFYCYFEGIALYEIFNDAFRFPKIKN